MASQPAVTTTTQAEAGPSSPRKGLLGYNPKKKNAKPYDPPVIISQVEPTPPPAKWRKTRLSDALQTAAEANTSDPIAGPSNHSEVK